MGFCKGAVGFLWCVGEGLCPSRGRPQGSPLRKRYKGAVRRADVGIGPYGSVTRSAVRRADVGIGPYGSVTRGAMGGRPQGSPLRRGYKRYGGVYTAAKNKIAPGFCQGRCAAPWYHLASQPAHAGGLMKCRYTSALLRAHPSEPKTQEALDPAAPEPCSPVRPAPAFTYSGSLGRSANGVLFPSLPL